MTDNEKAEQIAKIFSDAQEKLLALLKPPEEKKNVWLDRLDSSGGYFYCHDAGDAAAYLKFWVDDSVFAEKLAAYLDKNARRIYAEYVLQSIYERDYMPEGIDREDKDQEKYYIYQAFGGIAWGYVYYDAYQGTLYCTTKPDVQKIRDEMGEIFDWLWER